MIPIFHIQIDTLLRAIWRRCPKGWLRLPYFISRTLFFLGGICIAYILFCKATYRIMSGYAWFRQVDDIMDGEIALPEFDIEKYISEKEKVISGISNPHSTEDKLLLAITDRTEIQIIWRLMREEYKRRESKTLLSEKELHAFAYEQDKAILGFIVKALHGDYDKFLVFINRLNGAMTRTDWLEDMRQDMDKGLINIPSEFFGTPRFEQWRNDEIQTLQKVWRDPKLQLDMKSIFSSKFTAYFFQYMCLHGFSKSIDNIAVKSSLNEK